MHHGSTKSTGLGCRSTAHPPIRLRLARKVETWSFLPASKSDIYSEISSVSYYIFLFFYVRFSINGHASSSSQKLAKFHNASATLKSNLFHLVDFFFDQGFVSFIIEEGKGPSSTVSVAGWKLCKFLKSKIRLNISYSFKGYRNQTISFLLVSES